MCPTGVGALGGGFVLPIDIVDLFIECRRSRGARGSIVNSIKHHKTYVGLRIELKFITHRLQTA